MKTDLLSLPVMSTMSTFRWYDIAPDEFNKRCIEINNDWMEDRISLEEYERRKGKLGEEVLQVLGEPERSRPDNDSVLSTHERRIKQCFPRAYREQWGELWREWEEGTIPSTEEFWCRWGRAVLWPNGGRFDTTRIYQQEEKTHNRQLQLPRVRNGHRFEPYFTSSRSQSHDDSHQPSVGQQEWYATQLEVMQAALDESHVSVPVKIAQVTEVLQSEHALSRDKRNQMAQTLESVQDTLGRGFKKMGEGIAALLRAVRNGLLPVTSGYKALQEHFDELLQGISQLSVLHDLASKAYSKGLITDGQMSDMMSTNGVSSRKLASDFLFAIRSRVKRDGKAFDKFVAILKSEPAYEHLVALVGVS